MTRQIKVLIEDDEIEVWNFFRFLLLGKGYDVVTAYIGEELTNMADTKYPIK